MSTVNHNAVLATTWKALEAQRILQWIAFLSESQKRQFTITESEINGYQTICLLPDGSNEGWVESDRGDDLRTAFIAQLTMLDTPPEEEGCAHESHWHYVEVGYGEYGAAVLRTNCRNQYGDEPYAEPIEEEVENVTRETTGFHPESPAEFHEAINVLHTRAGDAGLPPPYLRALERCIEEIWMQMQPETQSIEQQIGSAMPLKFYQLPRGARFVFCSGKYVGNSVCIKSGDTRYTDDTGAEFRKFDRDEDILTVMMVED